MKLRLLFLFLLLSSNAFAGLFIQHAFFYNTSEDDADGATYSTMRNSLLFGATFTKSHRVALGWDYYTWNREIQGSSAANAVDLSLTEMGPRIFALFGPKRNIVLSVSWRPFAEGERTDVNGDSQDIEGSGMGYSLAYQFQLSTMSYLGVSLNYQTVSINQSIENSTETEVSESYTDLYPALEWSLRWK